jgi:hypothetical protein
MDGEEIINFCQYKLSSKEEKRNFISLWTSAAGFHVNKEDRLCKHFANLAVVRAI